MTKEAIIDIGDPKDNDLISRQAVLDLMSDYDLSMGQVVRGIHALPPVVSQPKVGKWIKNEEYDGYETTLTDCICSVCGENALLKKSYSMDGQSIVLCPSNYCPNCGCKMQEVKE